MRIAVVSGIHGNLTALKAVIADLAETAPDVVVHGGDLADGGRDRRLCSLGPLGDFEELCH